MLKTVVKIVNTITAVYVLYCGTMLIYNVGKEAGKKESASVDDVVVSGSEDGREIRIIDGVLYEKVKY